MSGKMGQDNLVSTGEFRSQLDVSQDDGFCFFSRLDVLTIFGEPDTQ